MVDLNSKLYDIYQEARCMKLLQMRKFNRKLLILWFDCFFRIQAFEQEKTDMQQLHNIQENVITLNVG